MSRAKQLQLQLEIAHLIDSVEDQAILVNLFIEVRTGGANAMLRGKTTKAIIDLKSIYGKKLDEAITILLNADHANKNKLTGSKEVPQPSNADQHETECGK